MSVMICFSIKIRDVIVIDFITIIAGKVRDVWTVFRLRKIKLIRCVDEMLMTVVLEDCS